MKGQDLRIGNWVSSVLHNGLHTEIFSVLSSDRVKIGANAIAIYSTDEIEPIPLTEEWLVNFGFEENYRSKFRVNYDAPNETIGYDFNKNEKNMEGFRFYGRWISGVKYVHQLQNIYFAITGEELTLKTK